MDEGKAAADKAIALAGNSRSLMQKSARWMVVASQIAEALVID
jgi:hypothetical protein